MKFLKKINTNLRITELNLLVFCILFIIFANVLVLIINRSAENIDNYEINVCYNTLEYDHCIYGLSKWRAMKAAAAYGADKNCVVSRVELVEGAYNIYFKQCSIYNEDNN